MNILSEQKDPTVKESKAKKIDNVAVDTACTRDTGTFIRELEKLLGDKYVTTDPCLLDTYAWQMNAETETNSRYLLRFMAVVLPANTQEVAGIVKLCNRFNVQYKATATGQGPWNGPGNADVAIQIDLRRMNQIIDIDEKNMFAVIEPYVTNNQIQTEAMKHGLNSHIHGAGAQASTLASATSFNGHGPDGISCGFSARNLLGFEWVTPDGEIVQAGSFDASNSMFLGDGPGPSLRGIVRGFTGACGGLGVFTKAAVKLYPWEGPKKLDVEGFSPYYYYNIPKHHIAGFASLPPGDYKAKADFGYALGEAEIASHSLMNAPALTIAAMYPDNNKASKGFKVPLLNKMHENFYMVFTAKHEKESKYKQRVINKLVSDAGGGFLGNDVGVSGLNNKARWAWRHTKDLGVWNMMKSAKGIASFVLQELNIHGYGKLRNGMPLDNTLYGALVRAGSNIRAVASFGGAFVTSMGSLVPWDVTVRSQQINLAIRKRLLKKGKLLLQDDGDGDHGTMYEGGTYSHVENVVMYDPTDKKKVMVAKEFNVEMNQASLDHKLGVPITSFGPLGASIFSEPAMNYDTFAQRIKSTLDPNSAAEASWYTDPSFEPSDEMKEIGQKIENDKCLIGELEMSDHATKNANSREAAWLLKRGHKAM